MAGSIVAAAVLALGFASGTTPPSQDTKLPIPDTGKLNALIEQVRGLFREEYSIRDLGARARFSRRLISRAHGIASGDQRFAMLVEARDIASEAGDIGVAFEAIDEIVRLYDCSSSGEGWALTSQKIAALKKAAKVVRSREGASDIAAAYISVAREGVKSFDYKAASDAVKQASSIARAAGDREVRAESKDLANEIRVLEEEFKEAQIAEIKLSIDPKDQDANLAVGRFYCFVKGDWESGLVCLAKGADSSLKKVAKLELESPIKTSEQVSVADARCDLSKMERKRVNKARYQGRARKWYESALRQADDLSAISIRRKLDALPQPKGRVDLIPLVDPGVHVKAGRAIKSGGGLSILTPGRVIVEIPYEPPREYNLLVVVKPELENLHFEVGLTWEGRQFSLVFDGTSSRNATGVVCLDGSESQPNDSTVRKKVFSGTSTVSLRVEVRKAWIAAYKDGERFFKWAGNPTRLSRSSILQSVDPKSLFITSKNGPFKVVSLKLTAASGYSATR